MKNLTRNFAIGIGLFVFLAGALAAAQPGPPIDPSQAGSGLIDAIGAGNWGLIFGFGIMLVVWGVRVFVWKSVNTKFLPWLAVGTGAALAFATAMVAAPGQWVTALLAGIQAGLAAAGTWGLLPGKARVGVKPKTNATTSTVP